MTIVVAPSTLFAPGATVAEDVFGDSAGLFLGNAAIQRFAYVGNTAAVVFGDAFELAGTARGGADRFDARGAGALFGDADTISGAARGGADLIYARGPSSGSQLTVVGDAANMSGGASAATTRSTPAARSWPSATPPS